MPLNWQKIEVPFGFGVDVKAHKYIASPPGVAVLANGRIDKDGQINVREGWENVAGRSNTEKLVAFKNRLYAIYSDPSAQTNNIELSLDCLNDDETAFNKQGGQNVPSALTECTIDGRNTIARDLQGSFSFSDIGIYETENIAVIAWIGSRLESGGTVVTRLYATVVDIDTLATVTPIQEISTGTTTSNFIYGCRVIIEGTTAYVVHVDAVNNTWRVKQYNLSTKTWGSDTALDTDIEDSPIPVWDAAEGGSGVWYIAYRDTASQLRIQSYLGAVFQNEIVVATEDPTAIAIHANTADDRVWVFWNDDGVDVKVAVYDTDLVSVLAPTVVETTAVQVRMMGIARLSSSQAVLVYTLCPATDTTRCVTKFRAYTDAGVAGTSISKYSVSLQSRPLVDGAHVYAIMGYRAGLTIQADGLQSLTAFYTVALVGIGDAFSPEESTCYRTCALWAQGTADPLTVPVTAAGSSGFIIPNLRKAFAAENKYWFTASVVAVVHNNGVDADGQPNIVQGSGIDLCRFDLDSSDRNRYAEFGQHLFFSGGQIIAFDGANIVEHGFFYPPEDVQGNIDAAGGDLSEGSYQIAIIWEYRMNSGAVMRSQPMLVCDDSTGATSFDVAANDAIDITLQHMSLTQKFNAFANASTDNRYFQALAAVVYRTEANGSIFYREGVIKMNDVFGVAAALPTIKVGDGIADDDIKANEQLYTTGGLLPNWSLPACDDVIVYKNRLFGISSEDKKQLFFTHVLNDAEIPAWHPFLVHRIDDDGDCVGLAVMDDNLVVFKESAIYLLRGNGPDAKGLNSDFITTKVQSPHGCMDRRSIVTDPLGVAFRSKLGIMRLSRGLQVEYFGVKVEDITTDTVELTTAAALPNYTERLYFGFGNTSSGDGGVLVYQWNNDQWAVDLIASNEEGFIVPLSIVWVDGTAYAAFESDSTIYAHREHEDPNDKITLLITSHWFKFDGQQGFKRIRNVAFLGEWHEDHDITFFFYRDYLDDPFQTITLLAAELVPAVLDPYQLKFHVSEQRMESFRYAFIVTPQASDSAESNCVTFAAQAFDVGIKPTMKRMPDAAMRG